MVIRFCYKVRVQTTIQGINDQFNVDTRTRHRMKQKATLFITAKIKIVCIARKRRLLVQMAGIFTMELSRALLNFLISPEEEISSVDKNSREG